MVALRDRPGSLRTFFEDAKGQNVSRTAKALGICLTGGLRGICSFEDGPKQLYDVLLRPFEAIGGFDAFLVVSHEDCDLAKKLFRPKPIRATVLCQHAHLTPQRELDWTRDSPKADPDICADHYCGYVFRDVRACGKLLERQLQKGTRYWRLARARLDLHWKMFPGNPEVALNSEQIIGYQHPDSKWIAMPDRFAIGPTNLMLETYFRVYNWMLDRKNWDQYDPEKVSPCISRGHVDLCIEMPEDSQHSRPLVSRGKSWPCPGLSAQRAAYPGPENILEVFLRSKNVAFHIRKDLCFDQIANKCGKVLSNFCERKAKKILDGLWLNGWFSFNPREKEQLEIQYMREIATPGSALLETRLLTYDGTFTGQLGAFLYEEWWRLGRPPKVVDLGFGRGILVEQLDRVYIPIIGIDGNAFVEDAVPNKGAQGNLAGTTPIGRPQDCHGLGATKAWCQWVAGLQKTDWALALNVVEDIPRTKLHRFAEHIVRHGKEGVILSWSKTTRPTSLLAIRRLLRDRRYRPDRSLSWRLQAYSNLLLSSTDHRSRYILALRRKSPENRVARVSPTSSSFCNLSLEEAVPESSQCEVGTTFGCLPHNSGIWVHRGCGGVFKWTTTTTTEGEDGNGNSTILAVPCISELFEYRECSEATPGTRPFSEEAHEILKLMLAETSRCSKWVSSQRAHLGPAQKALYTPGREPGIDVGVLMDLMDPLTTTFGAVWTGQQKQDVLTAALLAAFKMRKLRGAALAVAAHRWFHVFSSKVKTLLSDSPTALPLGSLSFSQERLLELINLLLRKKSPEQVVTFRLVRDQWVVEYNSSNGFARYLYRLSWY